MARYHRFHLDVDLEARMGRVLVLIHDRAEWQPHCNWGGSVLWGLCEPPAGEFRIYLGSIRHEELVLRLWHASGPP